MVKPIEEVDHVEQGNENFLAQYERSPVFISFVDAFLEEINSLEEQYVLFLTELAIQTAVGANLDRWGDILQAPQRPASDDDYRVLLYALIGAYYSEGHPRDIVAMVTSLVQADSVYFNDIGGAVFSLDILNPNWTFDPLLLADLVTLAKPIATQFLGFTTSVGPYFAFNIDQNQDADGFSVKGGIQGGYYNILIV